MNMPMCSRCKKNIAVVFITKIEGPDKTTQEGLCSSVHANWVSSRSTTSWSKWVSPRTTSKRSPVRLAPCPT